MARYGRCGRIVATSGNGDALAGCLLDAASALQDVGGCHLYVVSRDLAEAEAVWVVEFWERRGASSVTRAERRSGVGRGRVRIIAAMGEPLEFQALGGKGLAPEPA